MQPRSIFIVAGGPSAREFDFSLIPPDAYIIAVNDSFLSIPRCDAVVSIDRDWISWRSHALQLFQGKKFLLNRQHSPPAFLSSNGLWKFFDVAPGLGESWCCVHTVGCSGSAALNIAYLMRPQFIGLIGYDYDGSGAHWYEDRIARTNSRDTWAKWADGFGAMVPQLEAVGIEVVNYNPESRILAFPRRSADTICSIALA